MAPPATETRWEARIARARQLAAGRPVAHPALAFYAELAAFQQRLSTRHDDPQSALADLATWLEDAPDPIAERAGSIGRLPASWQPLLDAYLRDPLAEQTDPSGMFVVEALLQCFPLNPCPHCSSRPPSPGLRHPSPPVVSLLREAGHGSRRSYVCGLCLAESPAPRLGCFACGENRVEALPVFRTETTDPARIDACDSCRGYLKTIDLTRDGSACPIADDLASVALDLWAREHGYRRLRPNLLRL